MSTQTVVISSASRTTSRTRRLGAALETAVIRALIGLVLVWTLFPIAWLVMTSFKTGVDSITRPPLFVFTPTLAGYDAILKWGDFGRYFLNTIAISLGVAVIVTATSTLAGYSFSRFRFRGQLLLFFSLLGLRTIPPIAAVVPLFLLFKNASLMDTHVGVILLYSSFLVSFGTIMMKAFFDEIPREVEECAMVDGCGRTGAFLRICLPLAAPGLAGTAVFALISAWNEFFFALMFTSRVAKTAPVALAYFVGETGIDWGSMAAGATLVMIPSLFLTWLVQRNLVRGLSMGAVKG